MTSVWIWDGSIQHPKEIVKIRGQWSIISRDASLVAVKYGNDINIIDINSQPPLIMNGTDDEDASSSDDIYSLAFSDDQQTLVTGHWDGLIKLWRRQGDQWNVFKRLKVGHYAVEHLAFSRSGLRLACHSGSVWDVEDDTVIELEGSGNLYSVAFSPSGDQIVSGTRDGMVKIWSPNEGTIERTLEAHSEKINCFAFHDDGKVIATAGKDHRIRIWQFGNWEKIWEFDVGEEVRSLAFSPDGKRLVSGGDEGAVHLWDVDTGDNDNIEATA
ncbi:hypothetical protein ONZ45_g1999 [Pleurotus djamor]|nr:hypothetical protein ONZ45_g1999 [Pleurotus djamor]